MVSVIIPVYNTKPEVLKKSVKSVLDQSYSDLEILLIDDGSKKEFADAVDEIAACDSRIRVIHKENEGVSVARNLGTEQASGDYIMYVDGDDLLDKGAIEDGIAAAEATGCEVVIGRIRKNSVPPTAPADDKPNGGYTILDIPAIRDEFKAHIFTKGNPRFSCGDDTEFNGEGCWSHLIKRDTALKLKFREGVAVGEDTIWALDMIDMGVTICLSDKLWYYYILNDFSVLGKYNPNIIGQMSQPVAILNPTYLNSEGIVYVSYMKWILSKLKQILFRDYFAEENTLSKKEKKRKMKKAMSSSPWKEALKMRPELDPKVKLRLFCMKHMLMLNQFNE